MEKTILKCLRILIESLFFITIYYVLSSISVGRTPYFLYALFQSTKLFASVKYYKSVLRITGKMLLAFSALIACGLIADLVFYRIGYFHSEFTAFPNLH